MAALMRAHPVPSFRRTRNAFASLMRAIVYQQLSPGAAGTIHGRLCAHYGGRTPTPRRLLETPTPVLRQAGLSRAKADYIRDLAAHFADGRLSGRKLRRWSDERLASELIKVKGIGPWSVDMFLMFALQRPDVLPVGDLGVQKGMQTFFSQRDRPTPTRMRELARPWQPYRSAGCWYMWRLTDAAARTPAASRRSKRGHRGATSPSPRPPARG